MLFLNFIRKKLTALLSAAAVALTAGMPMQRILPDSMLTVRADVVTQCAVYSGSNLNTQNYVYNWATPIDSYLIAVPEGFMRFQNGALETEYLIEYYDTEYNILRTQTVAKELPIFGGFYAAEDYYFVLTGQTNPEENAGTECMRITKYDKNWNRLDSGGFYDCSTTVPFDAGSARFAAYDDLLFVHTSHEMYASSDGLNHQANITLRLDMETMETALAGTPYTYVSHSFNQFLLMDGDKCIMLDHGDAYPRAIVLTECRVDPASGALWPDSDSNCQCIGIETFPGETGENYTGASVGGFAFSDTSYLAAYAIESFDDGVFGGTRNIVIGAADRETGTVTHHRITDYAEDTASGSTPHLVKTGDNSFVLLWTREKDVYYTALDGEGNPDGIHMIENAALSDCMPAAAEGRLVWYTWNENINTFYEINLNDLTHSVTVIENGHRMNITDAPTEEGDDCTMVCEVCGEIATVDTPDSAMLCWGPDEYSYSSVVPDDVYAGDTLYYTVYDSHFTAAFHEYELTCSDPDAVEFTPSGRTTGTVTFLREGVYTITATHKYNPYVTAYVTIRVNHDKTHTLEVTPPEAGSNVATGECQDCDYTEEFTVPMGVGLNIETSDGYVGSTPNALYCPETDTLFAAYSLTTADNYDMTLTFSDPDMAVFTEKSIAFYDLYGSIDWQKTGTVDITVYPTYNPAAAETMTVKIGHLYADGVCTACGAVCGHTGGTIPPTCVSPAACAECGMESGSTDPENHASETLQCVPNEADAELHDLVHDCCGRSDTSEVHSFSLDASTGFYTCPCGAVAACSVTSAGTEMYFCTLEAALAEADRLTDPVITLLTDQLSPGYVSQKGDANLDSVVDAKDAAAILVFAAERGAGRTPYLVSETDAAREQLAQMLADVDASEAIDAGDASFVLIYAALRGSGEEADWDAIITG